MTISRRVFVRAGALGLVSFGLDPLFLSRAAYATCRPTVLPSNNRSLVCLFQRGAVDGLSMLVPHGEESYYRERPRIAIPRTAVVDLDGHFGLHPRLAPLKPFWDSGSLAVVPAVGSPDGTRSHFDAQDYMESGTPGVKSTTDGWANRYCQNAKEHTDTPFRAVAFGPQLPRIMAGTAPALAIDDLRTFGVGGRAVAGDRLTRAFEALYEGSATGLLAPSAVANFGAIRVSSRSGSPSWARRWRRSPPTWASECGMSACSPCRSSGVRCGRTGPAAPIMATAPPCWCWEEPWRANRWRDGGPDWPRRRVMRDGTSRSPPISATCSAKS